MRETLTQARKALFLEENPDEALQILTPALENPSALSKEYQVAMVELAGFSKIKLKRYTDAASLFDSIGDNYQTGYCHMLNGSLEKSVKYWQPLLQMRQNHWCLALYGMVSLQFNCIPTFFQIRNHAEADIMHLAASGQLLFMENMLKYTDFLADINFEAFKFVGRALFHAGFVKRAGEFLLRGQKLLPNDPEIYFHLGQYYHALEQYDEAKMVLQQCLLITPSYTPAIDVLNSIEKGPQTGV